MDVFKPDSGQITIDGKDFHREDYKIGYMPEERGLYPNVSISSQLHYLGELKGMKTKEVKESAEYWIDRFDLMDYYDKNLDTLSKGNQQKIQIIQAVLDDPDILILDEPFSGLDPVNARTLAKVMLEYVAKNRIVIFSSHQMASVEEFCDDIVLIDHGEIVLDGSLQTIKKEMGRQRKRLIIAGLSQDMLEEKLLSLGSFEIDRDDESLIVNFGLPNNEILNLLGQLGGDIQLYADYAPSLNDIFIEKVGDHDE